MSLVPVYAKATVKAEKGHSGSGALKTWSGTTELSLAAKGSKPVGLTGW